MFQGGTHPTRLSTLHGPWGPPSGRRPWALGASRAEEATTQDLQDKGGWSRALGTSPPSFQTTALPEVQPRHPGAPFVPHIALVTSVMTPKTGLCWSRSTCCEQGAGAEGRVSTRCPSGAPVSPYCSQPAGRDSLPLLSHHPDKTHQLGHLSSPQWGPLFCKCPKNAMGFSVSVLSRETKSSRMCS